MKNRRWIAVVALLGIIGVVEVVVWRTEPEAESPPTERRPLDYFPHLRPGEVVTSFEAKDLQGDRELIDYPQDGGKTLLFVFSATCGTCRQTIPHWNRLVERSRAPVRSYGLLVGAQETYAFQAARELLENGEVRFPVLQFMDVQAEEAYKVYKVPQTIVVGPAGVVEMCLMGVLTDELVDEIRSRLALGRPKVS